MFSALVSFSFITQKQHNGNGEPNSFMDNVYSSYVKNNELVFYFLFFFLFFII